MRKTKRVQRIKMQPQFFPVQEENEIVEADHHMLITKVVPQEQIPLVGADGAVLEGLFEVIPEYKIYKLFLNEFSDMTKHGINRILHTLQESGPNDFLEMHIAGPGGFVSEGLSFYNIISSIFRDRSAAYLNYGYSMNALSFLYCSERIVYEDSDLMFHNYSGGAYGKGGEMVEQVVHTQKRFQRFFRKLIAPYMTEEEINRMFDGKDFWFDSVEMLNRGIATGIILDGEYFTRDQYFEKHTKTGEVKKSWIKKQEKAKKKAEKIAKKAIKEMEEDAHS